jgi:predicted RecB family nuclease
MARTTDNRPEVTASMFFKQLACPHWIYFDAFGDPAKKKELSDFQQRLLLQGLRHEEDVIADLDYVEVEKGMPREERAAETLRLMREGVERIYHGVLVADDLVGEPDLLERRNDASSDLGAYHYVAVDIKSAERLNDAHKCQLSCYGELLRRVQGRRPAEGYVLNASKVRSPFSLADYDEQFQETLAAVRSALAGNRPLPHLSSGCKQSPWFGECKALAEETQDIALLYNVKRKTMAALRGKGIRTVPDAAAMDVDELADSSTALKRKTLSRIKVQAVSLLDKKHRIRAAYRFPEVATEIFFDIEGDPMRQVEYLFGFLVRDGGTEQYKAILAERPEDEETMWREFLRWLGTLPDAYAVYHYGAYEMSRMTSFAARYGGSKDLEAFQERMIDLNEVVKDHVVFPLYFYSIKDIGKYIGYERSGEITGGGDSISYYERWLDEGDRGALEAVIEYNTDDVIATRWLKDWLAGEFKAEAP